MSRDQNTPKTQTFLAKGSDTTPKRRRSFLRHGYDPELFLKALEEDKLKADLNTPGGMSNRQTVMALLRENFALMDEIDEANRARAARQGLGPHPLREEGRFSEPYGDAPNPQDLANQMGPKRSRATGPRPDPNTYAMAPEARLFTDPSPHAIGEEARFMEPYAEAPHPQAQPSPLRSALGGLGQGPQSQMSGHATEQDPFALTPPDPGYGRSDRPFAMTPPDLGSNMPLYGQGQNFGQSPQAPQYRQAQAPAGGFGANPAGGPAGYAQQVSYRPSGPQTPPMQQFYNTAASTSGPVGPVGVNPPHPATASVDPMSLNGGYGDDSLYGQEGPALEVGEVPELQIPPEESDKVFGSITRGLSKPQPDLDDPNRAKKAWDIRNEPYPRVNPELSPDGPQSPLEYLDSKALDAIPRTTYDGTGASGTSAYFFRNQEDPARSNGVFKNYEYPPRPEGEDFWPKAYIWYYMDEYEKHDYLSGNQRSRIVERVQERIERHQARLDYIRGLWGSGPTVLDGATGGYAAGGFARDDARAAKRFSKSFEETYKVSYEDYLDAKAQYQKDYLEKSVEEYYAGFQLRLISPR